MRNIIVIVLGDTIHMFDSYLNGAKALEKSLEYPGSASNSNLTLRMVNSPASEQAMHMCLLTIGKRQIYEFPFTTLFRPETGLHVHYSSYSMLTL